MNREVAKITNLSQWRCHDALHNEASRWDLVKSCMLDMHYFDSPTRLILYLRVQIVTTLIHESCI